MSDLPKRVLICEEGPREGFQIEPGPIATVDKVRLIEALGDTGVTHVQACSFVNPRVVPGWADADEVIERLRPTPNVHYTALWFNEKGLERALAHADKLHLAGVIALTASELFTRKNLNRSQAENLEAMKRQTEFQLAKGIPVARLSVMAAFGCNYQGDIHPKQVIEALGDGLRIADEVGAEVSVLSLADTMGWATPQRVETLVGAVRELWPDKEISLHLHDTRGLAVANAHAGLRMGVARFDATVGGLGGCPFAGQKGAAGNIATEELALLCEEMGIETGIDVDRLCEVGRMAEEIVGHMLPSELIRAGSINAFRRRVA